MTILILSLILILCLIMVLTYLRVKRIDRNRQTDAGDRTAAEVPEVPVDKRKEEKVKEGNVAEGEEKVEALYKRLCELMERDKMYLRPDLQRDELARMLNTNRTYLSKAVTRFAGKGSITDFINGYRLSYAAKLLKEEPDLNIREVELRSGFNSRETFNRTFRKHYGMTPREFKMNHSTLE